MCDCRLYLGSSVYVSTCRLLAACSLQSSHGESFPFFVFAFTFPPASAASSFLMLSDHAPFCLAVPVPFYTTGRSYSLPTISTGAFIDTEGDVHTSHGRLASSSKNTGHSNLASCAPASTAFLGCVQLFLYRNSTELLSSILVYFQGKVCRYTHAHR
jgi:hypothetical protein